MSRDMAVGRWQRQLRRVPLLALLCRLSASTLSVDVTASGAYSVQVDGATWLTSGDTALQSAGKWLSVAEGSLHEVSQRKGTDSDAVGKYHWWQFAYAVKDSSTAIFETKFKVYDSGATIEFQQRFPKGISGSKVGTVNNVSSSFPSFRLQQPGSGAPRLGCLVWEGAFMNAISAGPTVGLWQEAGGKGVGVEGGPRVLFDADGDGSGAAVVLSAAAEFMSHTTEVRRSGGGVELAVGLMGSVEEVPAGFQTSTVLHWDSNGVNSAVTSWGAMLLKRYNKSTAARDNDYTLQWLGYNTDNGAYYYYKTEPGKDYATTLMDVYKEAQDKHFPFKWILLDSWWYYKGNKDGVTNWTARGDIFPAGGDGALKAFHKATGWPIVGHNRFWASDTPYARQNGGRWLFSDDGADMVVPLEQEFWDWLLSTSKAWGLYTYEQDWLFNELLGVPLLTRSATQARTWLLQMGRAAAKVGLTIQYCMPFPRHALQSVEIQQVTQIRASDDYVPKHDRPVPQWNMGGSSILAHALGLAPFKDNFWTAHYEPGGHDGSVHNPDILRHSVVASLSAGPVTPSDGVGFADRGVILRSCRADGALLQPSRPVTFTDAFITALARGGGPGPRGHIWSTYSEPARATGAKRRWDTVFATELQEPYALSAAELNLDRPGGAASPLVAYGLNETSLSPDTLWAVRLEGPKARLTIPAATGSQFHLRHFAPLGPSGYALLGEVSKWVPVAARRVDAVFETEDSMDVLLVGAPGESVRLFFANAKSPKDSSGHLKLGSFDCTFGPSGRAEARIPDAACSPPGQERSLDVRVV